MEFNQIPMLNNLYEISSDGKHFRRFSTKKELKIMEGRNYGYSQVVVTINKKRPEESILISNPKTHKHGEDGHQITLKVHQLVYDAFIGEVPEGMVIDHIDRNKANNHFNNLRAVSHLENIHNRSCGWKFKVRGNVVISPNGDRIEIDTKDEAIRWIAEKTGRSYRTVYNSIYYSGEYRGYVVMSKDNDIKVV